MLQTNNSLHPIEIPAIIYCRVSTDRQENDGESLEYQEEKCLQYARLHNYKVIKIIKEAKSGYIHYSLREQLTIARQLIHDELAKVLIVFDLRRLSRNFVHSAIIFEEIEQTGGSVVSVSENIDNSLTGKLIRSILARGAQNQNATKLLNTLIDIGKTDLHKDSLWQLEERLTGGTRWTKIKHLIKLILI